jgi:nitronate monooxygenase
MSFAQLSTPLKYILPKIRTPIVCGPMAGAAGGALAAAVSQAGGFGLIGGGAASIETVKKEFRIAQSILGARSDERLPIGVGMHAWHLTQLNRGLPSEHLLSAPRLPSASDLPALPYIDACLECRPKAAWLAFGVEDEIVAWSRLIRKREAELQAQGTLPPDDPLVYFTMAGSMHELHVAVERMGADVVVVQGIESGGHGRSDAPPLHDFLTRAAALLPTLAPHTPFGRPPALLGAGGLADGRSLAEILALGAHGGVLGTRFLLTPEALYSDAQKALLVRSDGTQTVRSMAFDDARGTMSWPPNVDGRGIRTATVADYEEASERGDLDAGVVDRMERYKRAAKEGDVERLITWSGTGVSTMDKIIPAGEVVREITEEAVSSLRARSLAVH